MKIAINGFGRIGRQAFKIAREKDLDIVAINDLTRADELAHLLKFDSVYGTYPEEVKAYIKGKEFVAGSESLLEIDNNEAATAESTIVVGKDEIKVYGIRNPEDLPWEELGVDVVIESTGAFVRDDAAQAHMTAGAKAVVISAPSKGDNPAPTYVFGGNAQEYQGEKIVSNASCTTNCITPVTQVMLESFGIQKAMLTTTHAYTASQNLVDGLSKDLRKGRAAAANLVPTSTGAAIATTRAIPQLEGKFDGGAIRVPTPAGSISDLVYLTEQNVTLEQVQEAFRQAVQQERFAGVLAVSDAPLVSSDIIGRPESAIVDLPLIKVVDGNLVKVMAWYDNEWGYSNRLIEMAMRVVS